MGSSTPTLERIPAEISERISEHLDLADLQALRMTSRRVCSASSQNHFKRHFRTKTMRLSNVSALQRLRDSVIESEYARQLQHLDLLVADDEHLGTAKLKSIAQTIPLALGAIQQHLGGLKRLSIKLQGKPQLDDWKRTWGVIADGWEVLMHSLATSGLLIDELDAFTKSAGSISLDRFNFQLPSGALAGCFSHLRSVDLSLSNSPEYDHQTLEDTKRHMFELGIDENTPEDSYDSFYSLDFLQKIDSYHNSVCEFLNLCPNLQHLGLHWYSVARADHTAPFLESIVRQCALSTIQSVSLRGLHTSAQVLLRLAKESQLRSLEMGYVRLWGLDTFHEFFEYVFPNLDSIRLDDVWERRRMDFETSKGASPEWIRKGTSAREIPKYHPRQVFPTGRVEISQELAKRRRDYGPFG